MTAFLSWYIASSLLGWISFPLVFRLFPALAERGYTLARAAGILVWGWVFWLLAVLGVLRNDLGGVLFAILALAGLSAWAFWAEERGRQIAGSSSMIEWIKENKRLILVTEILFLLSFAFLAFVRAANPEAVGTEKPMELAFINATLRSPTLPPNDPWMSGYSISYYHFGYILTAMFARLTGVAGNVAFNLMSALVFALAAVGSYGILYNLLAATGDKRRETEDDLPTPVIRPRSSIVFLALFAPLFLLILSNAEGLLHVIHGLGWFWPTGSTSNFWTWLNIKDLTDAPSGHVETPFWWWWRASRVVQDFDLLNAPQEVIDEFPFFSFLLGDLHPHVLALPFNMLGIGVALNIFLDGWRGIVRFFEYQLRTTPRDFFFAALVIGGLAFLNTWDILPAAAMMVGAYVLARVRADGWSWQRLEDAVLLGLPLAIAAILLYLPFYLGFSSQAGGILPNLVNPTRGAQLWVMWATLLLPLLAWLLVQTFTRGATRPRYGTALALTLGLVLLLWGFSWLLALIAQRADPAFAQNYLASQGQTDIASFFRAATARRLDYIGGLLTIALVIWLALAHLLGKSIDTYDTSMPGMLPSNDSPASDNLPVGGASPSSYPLSPTSFALLLTIFAALLILAPDFVYLRDLFGYRINTVFKFYYQGWQLWSIAAAFGTVVLLQNLRGFWNYVWSVALILIVGAGLVYPVLSLPSKTNNFKPAYGLTLDASAHLDHESPEDAATIRYLQSAPMGVLAEAIGGSYSGYARMSTYSGIPTVLGWPWHEYQWRGNWNAHGSREADIKALYEAPDWETARAVIEKYHITYIVVGMLERSTYRVDEAKFQRNLTVLFQVGGTVVYGAP